MSRTGLDSVHRTLKMAARLKFAIDHGMSINGVDLRIEFGVSRATVKRFLRLYRLEFDEGIVFDFKDNTYRKKA